MEGSVSVRLRPSWRFFVSYLDSGGASTTAVFCSAQAAERYAEHVCGHGSDPEVRGRRVDPPLEGSWTSGSTGLPRPRARLR